ncbi:hypothetical protein PsorP6_002886 [Peronosclerospora sorghi]|uniref:Uncharacterized protein n=1 Tax=Peronosclerospora sorghi TaxID=230839 RepID=A0ACC0VLR5_9STRA|nr:hypothetical protein PsorP6_002886 [Peronosclerospora sorghi]
MRYVLLVTGSLSVVTAGPYDSWAPHRYCNDLANIETTRIPPLTAEQAELVESLEQVQIIARHGARAPYAKLFCWESNEHNPMNAEWNCTTTSVSSQDINPKEESNGFGRLYRKAYLNGHNILKGDCIIGGLLELGRQQQKMNGQCVNILSLNIKPVIRANKHCNIETKAIYLRSDDQERTLGSGQALVDGLFPTHGTPSLELHRMLAWNVADISVDYIGTNDNICPMMKHIGQIAYDSPELWKHRQDPATVAMEHHFIDLVGDFSWETVLECLSIARCNDLQLPGALDEKTFTEIYHEVEVRQGIFLTYNDSWYAKIAMQPLAHDMLSRLNRALNGSPDAYKLSITMAHDSTIMPFLAATLKENWDRTWTPYASMLVIELYKTKSGSHSIRMIFHGEPQVLPGCPDALCDIKTFSESFDFAQNPRTEHDCVMPERKKHMKNAASLMTTTADKPNLSLTYNYVVNYFVVGVVAMAGLVQKRAAKRAWGFQTCFSLFFYQKSAFLAHAADFIKHLPSCFFRPHSLITLFTSHLRSRLRNVEAMTKGIVI